MSPQVFRLACRGPVFCAASDGHAWDTGEGSLKQMRAHCNTYVRHRTLETAYKNGGSDKRMSCLMHAAK
jgi:hypothetical protein